MAAGPVQPGNSDLCFVWDGPIEEAVAHLERLRRARSRLGPVERHGARRDRARASTSATLTASLLEFIAY